MISGFMLASRQKARKQNHSRLKMCLEISRRKERWLFVSAHDDDIIIGSGLLIQKAVQEGVDVAVLISSDGSMGYCDIESRDSIAATRAKETISSFLVIGVDNVSWLDYQDGNLSFYRGKRKAEKDCRGEIAGHTGLQNSYTFHLRKYRPTRVFVPSGNDIHRITKQYMKSF